MKIELDKLWDYADGFLSEPERQSVEAHLQQDVQARQMLEDIMAEKQALNQTPMEKPKPMFADKIMAAWVSDQVARGSITYSVPPRDWVLTIISLVLVLFLVVPLVALIINVGSFDPVGVEIPQIDWATMLSNALLKYALLLTFAFMTFRLVDRYWQYRKFMIASPYLSKPSAGHFS